MSKLGKRLIVSRKGVRSTRGLTTLDDFLKSEGKLEEFEALAIKEARAIARGKSAKRRSRKRDPRRRL